MLKAKWPELQVVTDVCLCEYTSHGHCGILKEGDTCGEVVNDPTLELLAKTALSHVEAGADMVAAFRLRWTAASWLSAKRWTRPGM